ncbi:Alkaline phosphatase synthesis sensor protein PhoR [compost metagenome]
MEPDAAPDTREALLARIAELEAENRRLREGSAGPSLNARADDFLAVVSHELRTPIHVMMGFLSILSKGVGGPLSEQQRGYLDKALGVTEVLARLVNEILDLAQVRAGTFTIHPAPCDPLAVVRGCLEAMAPIAEQKPIALLSDLPADLPMLRADAVRLTQVTTNLLSNALKFTDPGGRVTVRARAEGHALRFEVIDTGIGISSADQRRLFQPFTQLDMSQTRQVGGIGIGLSICRAIVEAHGGHIGVESVLGQGSTFWFSLPLSGETP